MPVVPNFSVKIYFIFMFLLLAISTTAFSCLHFSPVAVRERKENAISKNKAISCRSASKKVSVSSNDKDFEKENELDTVRNESIETSSNSKYDFEKKILLIITFITAFLYYGFLPGLQSYATLPYGKI